MATVSTPAAAAGSTLGLRSPERCGTRKVERLEGQEGEDHDDDLTKQEAAERIAQLEGRAG